ncbi:NAD(P)-binding domain-containing protein [Kibdelosporangium phytohabitans]|uniref:NAD(P)-binding domain-containing protein n=1 Tax=Kibdelosporangium phytohabitans TaxID=860235 RepID=UPI000AEED61B|nr:3-hydroxyisobutyrate dehydrogenase [Kibdelosporangium phytohabitans]
MIAFLGPGTMGGPMAANLVEAGHEVAATRDAEVVITMLPSGRHLLDCYAKIVAAAKPGTLFIDCSTVDVADARAAATSAGHLAADAPVSGGVVGAAVGSLTFIAGGADEAAAKARAAPARDGCPLPLLWTVRGRSGREDLQQHDPRCLDGRGE